MEVYCTTAGSLIAHLTVVKGGISIRVTPITVTIFTDRTLFCAPMATFDVKGY
jgi:hypothetical protein